MAKPAPATTKEKPDVPNIALIPPKSIVGCDQFNRLVNKVYWPDGRTVVIQIGTCINGQPETLGEYKLIKLSKA